MNITLSKSNRKNKKWMVKFDDNKTIHFGDSRYQDYTQHQDYKRAYLYQTRHHKNENWTKSGIKTAGFWSRWLLWNKTDIDDALKDIEKSFNVKINKT